jgi:hypothetical protein
MEHGPLANPGDDASSRSYLDQDRNPFIEAPHHLPICVVYGTTVRSIEPAERRYQLGIPARRNPPVDVEDFNPLVAYRVGEPGEPDVDDPNFLRKGDGAFLRSDRIRRCGRGYLTVVGHRGLLGRWVSMSHAGA